LILIYFVIIKLGYKLARKIAKDAFVDVSEEYRTILDKVIIYYDSC